MPDITRAVLVLHGRLRNADVCYRSARTAEAAAGDAGTTTVVIVPQFLAGIDVDTHHLPPDTLHWSFEGWEGGDPAEAPVPASSFEALDAILVRLADRRLFPNLKLRAEGLVRPAGPRGAVATAGSGSMRSGHDRW